LVESISHISNDDSSDRNIYQSSQFHRANRCFNEVLTYLNRRS
jgi:hypothetical protein